MPRKAPKMTNLLIEETSGVDHPAHLHEGWLVVKASDVTTVADVMKTLPETLEVSMEDATATVGEVMLAEDMPKPDEEEAKGMEEDLAMAQARIVELESRIAELESEAEETDAEDMMESADDLVSLAKSAPEPIRKALEQMAKEKAQAEEALRKEREDRADAESITKARETFKHLNLDPEKIGPALRRLSAIDAELAKAVEDTLVSADAQNESADIFREVGKGYVPQSGAYEKMTSLAKQAVSEGSAATLEQAMAQIAVSNPALYNDYLIEKGA